MKVFSPSSQKVEQVELKQTEKLQDSNTAEVVKSEPVSQRPPRKKMVERSSNPTAPQPVPKPRTQQLAPEEQLQADKLLQAVKLQYSLARKSPITYKKMVDFCRELLTKFPNSQQAEEARELLRRMPKRYRELYKVTNEELGLTTE